ncbi:hypothetical protein Tco_0264830 [Tanacetum coccineum]
MNKPTTSSYFLACKSIQVVLNWIIETYDQENPHRTLKNKGIIDSGCSRHMTGNKAYLADYQDINGGPDAFGGRKRIYYWKGYFKKGNILWFKRDLERIYNARTPQQNGVAEKEKQDTLLKASARTMLADSIYLTLFGTEAVIQLGYVLKTVN